MVQYCYFNIQDLNNLPTASIDVLIDLLDEFYENTSETETATREILTMDFEFISKVYGFAADI
ncbi:DUF5713 family protein [Maribacter arcticus]|uniref:DUF5713 family protein n=1 Tax=Maribacter arcticus TaxID=561365 RepID=UPI003AB999C1